MRPSPGPAPDPSPNPTPGPDHRPDPRPDPGGPAEPRGPTPGADPVSAGGGDVDSFGLHREWGLEVSRSSRTREHICDVCVVGASTEQVGKIIAKDMAMLAVTFLVSAVTLGTGRTNVMQGAVHLVLFAAYLFLAFVP